MTKPTVVTDLHHLGALAAHHVLGWEMCDDLDCDGCDAPVSLRRGLVFEWDTTERKRPRWVVTFPGGIDTLMLAHDIRDAWRLVCHLQAGFHMDRAPSGEVLASFDGGGFEIAVGEAPAICAAALRWVGHPVRLELEP